MGQPIVVTEKPSSYPGVVRFETNRALTGMGHERYVTGTEVWGERPPDELARRLLTQPSVMGVQINSNVVTVDLAKGYDSTGLRQIVEDLYIFYPESPAEVPAPARDETETNPAAAAPPDEPAPAVGSATAPDGSIEAPVPTEPPAEGVADQE